MFLPKFFHFLVSGKQIEYKYLQNKRKTGGLKYEENFKTYHQCNGCRNNDRNYGKRCICSR